MRKAAFLAGSHLFCLLAGGFFLNAASEPRHKEDAGRAATKRGERTARDPLSDRGSALAAEMLAATKAPRFDAGEAEQAARSFAGKGGGEKRVRELTAGGSQSPPETAEFAGALLAWFRDDPKAAAEFIEAAAGGAIYEAVLVQATGGMSLADHLKLAESLAGSPAIFRVGEILGERLAGLDPAAAVEFFKNSGISQNRALLQTMVRGWPGDAVGSFAELAVASGDLMLLQAYLGNFTNPRKASALLVMLDARDDLPDEFKGFLQSSEMRGHLFRYADPSVPLDTRINEMKNLAWLKDATPGALREGALKQISTVDINELMKSGPDYRYAFRHGAMTADEVLAAVRGHFPELASASDYETRVRVFNELASEDAQAAYALIAHLPEEQRNLAVIHQSRWSFRSNSPEAFYEMINLAPGPDSQEAAPQRADAWNTYGQRAYREYGDSYVEWVRDLPAGVNRDAARASLANALKQSNQADLAAEFEQP